MKIDPQKKSRNQHKEMKIRNRKINEYQKELNRLNELKNKKKNSLYTLKLKVNDEIYENKYNYLLNKVSMNYLNICNLCSHLQKKIDRMKLM
tara:strand:- start:139 stop:414 length:276 start_codon:yes stop_codon:yes gene_type:complete